MNRRRINAQRGSDMLLHAWRSLFIVTALVVSLLLAYFPGYPPAANAETAPTPSAPETAPGPTIDPGPAAAPTPDPGAAPSPAVTPDPGPDTTPDASPSPTADASPSPTPTPPASLAGVEVVLSTDLPGAAPPRINPGKPMVVTATVRTTAELSGARLTVAIPAGWSVTDINDGTHNPVTSTVGWDLPVLAPASSESRSVGVVAPEAVVDGSPFQTHEFTASIALGADSIVGPPLLVDVAPPISIISVSAGRVTAVGEAPDYLDSGEPLRDEPRFEVFRLRFEIVNGTTDPAPLQPQIEYAGSASATFVALPAGEAVPGVPFYAAPEWVRVAGAGTAIGPAFASEPGIAGAPHVVRSMGLNPMPVVSLTASTTTLVEFSVRATVDAEYEAGYLIRLTDAGTPLLGAAEAAIVLASRPPVILSPGQQSGVSADAPARTLSASWTTSSLHSPNYDLATDACAACHRAHTAQGTMLSAQPTEYGLCVSCHNGVDAPDVASAYNTVPANDPEQRAYYQHDPTTATGPLGTANACSDCHNPHDSTATAPVMGADGWTTSGRIAGASGVSVANGPGSVTYTLIARVELEYQLCFKCHSGNAQLPSNTSQPPSRMALDKGVELDPRNPSYHPVEAPGTNGTDQMNASLQGTSPYKRWTFSSSSTIRCVNCHADSRVSPFTSEGSLNPPDSNLPVHASPQRGILIEPYLDRTLMGAIEPYSAANFALCYVCHAEAPFRDTSGEERGDTSFRYHGLHVSSEELQDHGNPATGIDVPGDGAGLATCAECHFRIHSTAYSVDGQAPGPRLVNFAPNVTGRTGFPLSWQLKTATQTGSCSLRCHGEPHTETY